MQQANEDALRMIWWPLDPRIRQERWRRSGIGEYAISVDKSDLPVCEREKDHRHEAAKILRKTTCVRCRTLYDRDCQIAAHIELQFLGDPLRRVFFFLGHRISFRW
jgi:hypothetical protein